MAKKESPKGLLLKIGPRKIITLEDFFNPKTESHAKKYLTAIEQHMMKYAPEIFIIYSAMEKKVDNMSERGGASIFSGIASENNRSFAKTGFLLSYAAKRAYSEV